MRVSRKELKGQFERLSTQSTFGGHFSCCPVILSGFPLVIFNWLACLYNLGMAVLIKYNHRSITFCFAYCVYIGLLHISRKDYNADDGAYKGKEL